MSFKGQIEAKCPKGCEPFEADYWTFIRGDTDVDLRLALKARECNLLLCPSCGGAFFPEEAYIYFEPVAEILAFVFPESFRDKEQFWRQKMRSDFEQMQKVLGESLPSAVEPVVLFGVDPLAELLEQEDFRGEEREVMEWVAKDLGLSIYSASPRFAREHDVPAALPYAGSATGPATRESVMEGLERVLAANDRLESFRRYLDKLRWSVDEGLPPRAWPGGPA